MIEVHIFNSFLKPELKNSVWFMILNYINGLVAPSFIFISGFIFVLLSFRKAPEYRKFGDVFFKQIRRIFLIWICGYFIHVPYYSLKSTLTKSTPEKWMMFFQSDVLQCIALGLMILFISSIIFKSAKTYQTFLFTLGTIIIFSTPFIWYFDFTEYIHPFFAAYLNPKHYSIFPIFPWLGFMLYGGTLAPIYLKFKEQNKETYFFKKLTIIGIVFTVCGILLSLIPLNIPFTSSSLKANPFFFFERLGIVFLLLALCWYYAIKRNTTKSFVLTAGKESLFIYVGHLIIMYGAFFNYKSINQYVNASFGIAECVIATLILVLIMIFSSIFWNKIKTNYPSLSKAIFTTTWVIIFYNFFLKGYLFR